MLGVIATFILVGASGFLVFRENKISPPPPSPFTLGGLCSGEVECEKFCNNNMGQCGEYCKTDKQNPLCPKNLDLFHSNQESLQNISRNTKTAAQTNDPKNVSETSVFYRKTAHPDGAECRGSGPVQFVSAPMRVEEVSTIVPLGQMGGGHVTPTDHGYYHTFGWKPGISDPSKYRDILAPADGVITSLNIMGDKSDDYRMEIYHTCTFYTIYIHIRELSQRILDETGGVTKFIVPNISVKAGEVIGRASGFDFSVHNSEVQLKGFLIPSHYDSESWKIHTVDMFDSFIEPIKSQLLARNIRQAEPRSGKIDYDIDGRLVGNWFVENTNGYRGSTGRPGDKDYWKTHLSIAYDNLDPLFIIVSIGNFNGEAKQFAVKGNAPDPSTVSTESGLVKYELVGVEYLIEGGQIWNRSEFAKISKAIESGPVEGVVLAQLLENRKLKFEAFSNKTAEQVSSFTDKAIVYER